MKLNRGTWSYADHRDIKGREYRTKRVYVNNRHEVFRQIEIWWFRK